MMMMMMKRIVSAFPSCFKVFDMLRNKSAGTCEIKHCGQCPRKITVILF